MVVNLLNSALEGDGWPAPHPGLFTRWSRDPIPIVQEAEWDLGSGWKGPENIFFTGVRIPDRLARSEELY
jgi:hypothetical protein